MPRSPNMVIQTYVFGKYHFRMGLKPIQKFANFLAALSHFLIGVLHTTCIDQCNTQNIMMSEFCQPNLSPQGSWLAAESTYLWTLSERGAIPLPSFCSTIMEYGIRGGGGQSYSCYRECPFVCRFLCKTSSLTKGSDPDFWSQRTEEGLRILVVG